MFAPFMLAADSRDHGEENMQAKYFFFELNETTLIRSLFVPQFIIKAKAHNTRGDAGRW